LLDAETLWARNARRGIRKKEIFPFQSAGPLPQLLLLGI